MVIDLVFNRGSLEKCFNCVWTKWQASCTLEAGVKIHSTRVDSVHTEAYKVLGGLNRTAGATNDNCKWDLHQIRYLDFNTKWPSCSIEHINHLALVEMVYSRASGNSWHQLSHYQICGHILGAWAETLRVTVDYSKCAILLCDEEYLCYMLQHGIRVEMWLIFWNRRC